MNDHRPIPSPNLKERYYCRFWKDPKLWKETSQLFIPERALCDCHFWEAFQELIAKQLSTLSIPQFQSVIIYGGDAEYGPIPAVWQFLRKILVFSPDQQSSITLIIRLPRLLTLFLIDLSTILNSDNCNVSSLRITKLTNRLWNLSSDISTLFSVLQQNHSVHQIELIFQKGIRISSTNSNSIFSSFLALLQTNKIIDQFTVFSFHSNDPPSPSSFVELPFVINHELHSRQIRISLYFHLCLHLFHRAKIRKKNHFLDDIKNI